MIIYTEWYQYRYKHEMLMSTYRWTAVLLFGFIPLYVRRQVVTN